MEEQESRIREEIRQSRPFRSPAHEAVAALLRTADLLRRGLGAVVEPSGVTIQQYNVLRILRGTGEAGLPTLDIAQRMVEHAPGITRLLDRLERKGWVERWRCLEDRRQVLCRLTAGGSDLLAGLDLPVAEAEESFFSPITADGQRRLVALLDTVRSGPSQAPDELNTTGPDAPESRRNPR